jgi:hypothetical protein
VSKRGASEQVSKRGASDDVARESDSMGGSRILTTLTTSMQCLLSAAPALCSACYLQSHLSASPALSCSPRQRTTKCR